MAKKRLDIYVTEKFALESRRLSQNYIIQGRVFVNGAEERKPGYCVKDIDVVDVDFPEKRYVSRGGLKLEYALEQFLVDPRNLVCIDAGASTGGFTDCLLKKGASKVYAVDVGKGQLDYSLRMNKAVVTIENFNVRYIDESIISEKADIITADLSFISLDKALRPLAALLKEKGIVVALVKPQFEAGKGKTNKGVVRDMSIHVDVLKNAVSYGLNAGLYPVSCVWSPIKGPSGNIEFFMLYSKDERENACFPEDTVKKAWAFFDGVSK